MVSSLYTFVTRRWSIHRQGFYRATPSQASRNARARPSRKKSAFCLISMRRNPTTGSAFWGPRISDGAISLQPLGGVLEDP
jgi:hypothetical protein